MDSVWTKTVCMSEFSDLNGDIKTDGLIIGGGLRRNSLRLYAAAGRRKPSFYSAIFAFSTIRSTLNLLFSVHRMVALFARPVRSGNAHRSKALFITFLLF